MATRAQQVDFYTEQMAGAGAISARMMFGEYAIYCDGKVVALVCDDELFVRPSEAGRAFLGQRLVERPPYPKAKLHFHISADQAENGDWLADLIRRTADELPLPKKKPAKKRTANKTAKS